MNKLSTSFLLKRMTFITSLLALSVIVLGAFVRLSDAGLACPDWPGCFGKLVVPSPHQDITSALRAFPDSSLHPTKAWIEMIHRYLAGTLGLLVLGLATISWQVTSLRKTIPLLSLLLLFVVVFQALLGMFTVTQQLKPIIVTLHLFGGMTTLSLLVLLLLLLGNKPLHSNPAPHYANKIVAMTGLIVLIFQISLGAWTSSNYAGLVCTDFPTCLGEWLPPMNFSEGFSIQRTILHQDIPALTAIHWTHRMGALTTSILLIGLFFITIKFNETKKLALLMLGLLITQISLGVFNVILTKPLLLALMHNMFAAMLLVIVVIINFHLWAPEKPERNS